MNSFNTKSTNKRPPGGTKSKVMFRNRFETGLARRCVVCRESGSIVTELNRVFVDVMQNVEVAAIL